MALFHHMVASNLAMRSAVLAVRALVLAVRAKAFKRELRICRARFFFVAGTVRIPLPI
jgi:L-asparaginase II